MVDILKQAFQNLEKDLIKKAKENNDSGVSCPTFEWFCELTENKSHVLYIHYIKPIYLKKTRKKKFEKLLK